MSLRSNTSNSSIDLPDGASNRILQANPTVNVNGMASSTYGDNSNADFNEDTEYLIRCDQSKLAQPR